MKPSINTDLQQKIRPQDRLYFSDDKLNSSWIIDYKTCRVQTLDPTVGRRMKSWSFAKLNAWGINYYCQVYIIPRNKWKWVMKELKINGPIKKIGRVTHGENLGKQNIQKWAENHSTFNQKDSGNEITTLPIGEAL